MNHMENSQEPHLRSGFMLRAQFYGALRIFTNHLQTNHFLGLMAWRSPAALESPLVHASAPCFAGIQRIICWSEAHLPRTILRTLQTSGVSPKKIWKVVGSPRFRFLGQQKTACSVMGLGKYVIIIRHTTCHMAEYTVFFAFFRTFLTVFHCFCVFWCVFWWFVCFSPHIPTFFALQLKIMPLFVFSNCNHCTPSAQCTPIPTGSSGTLVG